MRAGQGTPIEAVDRALVILDALSRGGLSGFSLAELALSLGLNKSTVHRTLAALRVRDYAAQDQGTGAYVLGPAAIGLHERYFDEEQLPLLLHPALVALSAATAELVHLGVLNGAQVLYLDKVEPQRSVRVWSSVGHRTLAARTALGRALLAFRGTGVTALGGYLDACHTDEAVTPGLTVERLWEALEDARLYGYAREREENEPGISCVAVPLMRAGVPVAAISITAPAERMGDDRLDWLRDRIRVTLPALLPEGMTLPVRLLETP